MVNNQWKINFGWFQSLDIWMVSWLHLHSTFTRARRLSPDPLLLCSHQRWEQMPVLRWSCRCAEIPERKSLKPLFESCQQCAIRCSEHRLCIWQPSTPKPRTSPSRAGLVHSSLTVDSAALSFFILTECGCPRQPHSGYLFFYLFIYFFVSSSVWFCFAARSCSELSVWLEMCWLVLLWCDSLQLCHHFSLAPRLLQPVRFSVWNCRTLWQGEYTPIYLSFFFE